MRTSPDRPEKNNRKTDQRHLEPKHDVVRGRPGRRTGAERAEPGTHPVREQTCPKAGLPGDPHSGDDFQHGRDRDGPDHRASLPQKRQIFAAFLIVSAHQGHALVSPGVSVPAAAAPAFACSVSIRSLIRRASALV